MAGDGGLELLELVGQRLDFLSCLQRETLDKRDLVSTLPHSRSTVDRALRDLETAGLVRRVDDGYETTLTGRLLADTYREYVTQAGDVFEASPVLDVLPSSAPVGARLLRGASVSVVDEDALGMPAAVEHALTTADRVRGVLPTMSSPWSLERWGRRAIGSGLAGEVVVGDQLYDRLKQRYGETLRALAATGNNVFVGAVPAFGLLLVESDGETSVSLIAYAADGTPAGVLYNDTPAAVTWAESVYDRVRTSARDVTAEVRELTPAADGAGVATQDGRWMLANAGFVTVDERYFQGREPADLVTGWRTGLDLVEIDAGYAVERTADGVDVRRETGDSDDGSEPRALADALVSALAAGSNLALVGPPGSGKSTVCKSVACRWAEDYGTVYYRGADGEPFTAGTLLTEAIRDETDPVLVVVEDAVRADANAVFEVMAEYRGREDVVFLVDARESEWHDPPEMLSASVEAYRLREVETVRMPALGEREVERFIDRFETATGQTVETPPDELLAAVQTADAGETASPGELLLLLHRLTLLATPATSEERPVTSLLEDVRGTYDLLESRGEFPLDVGVLVNVLNAAGVSVTPEYVYALSPDETAVRNALDVLSGRVLFPGEEAELSSYRSVHDAWSTLFLETLLESEGERAAHVRFARVLSAVLSLADDGELRARLERTFGGETETLSYVATAPREWSDGLLERVFAIGVEQPVLAPLFGETGYSELELPAVRKADLPVRVSLWRGNAALAGGTLDRAEAEFERALEAASAGSFEEADRLRGRALMELGLVAFRRGDADRAEEYGKRALSVFEALGDRKRVADNKKRLGNVSWMRGELALAEDRYRESLVTYRDIDDRQGEAYALHNIGNVVDARGETDTAESIYRDCLEMYREVGTASDEASLLNNLGVIAENRGDLQSAREYYERSLERYREVGADLGVANERHNLGMVANKQGDSEAAEEYARQALAGFRETGDTQGEAAVRRLLASIMRKRGQLAAATEYAERSLELCREVGDRKETSTVLAELARVDRDRGRPADAREHANLALSLSREVGTPRMEATCLQLLASVEREAGNIDLAREHLAGARSVAGSADDRLQEAAVLEERGKLDRERGDYERASERFERAADTYRAAGAVGDALAAFSEAATAAADAGVAERKRDLEARRRTLEDDSSL